MATPNEKTRRFPNLGNTFFVVCQNLHVPGLAEVLAFSEMFFFVVT